MFRRIKLSQKLLTRSSSSVATTTNTASPVVQAAAAIPAVPKAAAPTSTIAVRASTLFERFSSFLIGTGIGFGLTFYFILEELKTSNKMLETHLDKLSKRITAVETKRWWKSELPLSTSRIARLVGGTLPYVFWHFSTAWENERLWHLMGYKLQTLFPFWILHTPSHLNDCILLYKLSYGLLEELSFKPRNT